MPQRAPILSPEEREALVYSSTASIKVVDFRNVPDVLMRRNPRDKNWEAPRRRYDSLGRSMDPKDIRARARRQLDRINREEGPFDLMTQGKPIEEWDLEELARGRVRNALGTFAGPAPKYITRAVHEAATDRFKAAVKTEMGAHTVTALSVIEQILGNDDIDDKGKAVVPATTKLQAAQFLIEHLLGKPTQRTETDISVKLQGILAGVMVNPTDSMPEAAKYALAHLPGVTMPMAEAEAQDIDDADIIDG